MIFSTDMLVNSGLILQPCWKFRVTSCYCDAALLVLSACRSQGSDLRALNPPKQPMTLGIQKRDSDPNMQSTRKGKTILVRWDLCRVVMCGTLYNHVSKNNCKCLHGLVPGYSKGVREIGTVDGLHLNSFGPALIG